MEKLVREILPDGVRESFDAIVEQKILGASRHISMIGEMFEEIARRGAEEKRQTGQVIGEIKQVADYFISTRGEASQAVANAIRIMIQGIDNYAAMEIDEAAKEIIHTKDDYRRKAAEDVSQCVKFGVTLAKDMKNIFVYDYSSTVEKFLRGLSENGHEYNVLVAESRVIDGGKPFVKACREAGHHVKFIPEASMMYYIKECDAVFMGAETFYPDGTGFNTTGSDIVGLLCKYFDIPLYFITPMIKLDVRPAFGGKKNLVFQNLERKLSEGWTSDEAAEDIDFITPELVGVKPEFIHAFITEKGIIPSGQMYEISMDYSRKLRGE
ncbi:MAG: hypothetical protein Q4D60_00330 [Eubacteriales bacterium]|nr:hypothetical protein [Eubacteriales bacterium]